jgi:hypothetical protein
VFELNIWNKTSDIPAFIGDDLSQAWFNNTVLLTAQLFLHCLCNELYLRLCSGVLIYKVLVAHFFKLLSWYLLE